jgi:hypothetical protein
MEATMTEPGNLLTPVLVKDRADLEWPAEARAFYVLARNGLHLVRRHEFFESCVPARQWPRELEPQTTFLRPRFPVIPTALFERVVGFFARVADLHGCEAGVLLVWDRNEQCVRLVVPDQVGTMSRGWSGKRYPIGLRYSSPAPLPPHCILFGDIHSHVDMAAYASGVDQDDEVDAPGLHIVIGRIHSEPPDVHVEAAVDGARFPIEAQDVIEGYGQRDLDVPQEWLDRVKVEIEADSWYGSAARASTWDAPLPGDLRS